MKNFFKGSLSLFLVISLCITLSGCFYMGGSSSSYPSGGGYDNSYDTTPSYDNGSGSAQSLSDLTVNTPYVGANAQSNVSFSVSVQGSPSFVELYSADGFVSNMTDDGLNLDSAAGDGIYSAYISIDAQDPEVLTFYAQSGSLTTEHVTVEILPVPTAADASNAANVIDSMSAINETYYYSASVQMSQAENKITELYNKGDVIAYEIYDNAIHYIHKTGMNLYFTPYTEDTLAVGDGSMVDIITMEPHAHQFEGQHLNFTFGGKTYSASGYTDKLAKNVTDTFYNYLAPSRYNYDYESVTPDIFKNIGQNKVVIWMGHGGYVKGIGPILATGEKFDQKRYSSDSEYHNMFVNGEYVAAGNVCITPRYINKNVNNLSGSVIFLNACESGRTDELARAFMDKGAVCVTAYSSTVYTKYATVMQFATVTMMTRKNSSTGDYYTLAEAVSYAKTLYGYSDSKYGNSKLPGVRDAEFVIFGEVDAKTLRFGTMGTQPPAEDTTPTTQKPQTQAPATQKPQTQAPTTQKPQTQAPATQKPTPTYTNSDAHAAYKKMIRDYEWIPYCSSNISEVVEGKSKSEYKDMWLGSYYVLDIDDNGIDELVIKTGQSIGDMSVDIFTYSDGTIYYAGGTKNGDCWVMERTDGKGAVLRNHHGSLGTDVHINLNGTRISITNTKNYNYDQPSYYDDMSGKAEYVDGVSVHDTKGL